MTPTQAPDPAADLLAVADGRRFPCVLADPPWQFVNRTLAGVPEDEKKQLLYGNAMRVYGL